MHNSHDYIVIQELYINMYYIYIFCNCNGRAWVLYSTKKTFSWSDPIPTLKGDFVRIDTMF